LVREAGHASRRGVQELPHRVPRRGAGGALEARQAAHVAGAARRDQRLAGRLSIGAALMRALVAALLLASVAHAEPVTLRLATVAPDGTGWARELKAFGREVTTATHDNVQVKWYLGGIAGDELQQHERVM